MIRVHSSCLFRDYNMTDCLFRSLKNSATAKTFAYWNLGTFFFLLFSAIRKLSLTKGLEAEKKGGEMCRRFENHTSYVKAKSAVLSRSTKKKIIFFFLISEHFTLGKSNWFCRDWKIKSHQYYRFLRQSLIVINWKKEAFYQANQLSLIHLTFNSITSKQKVDVYFMPFDCKFVTKFFWCSAKIQHFCS